jgi:hypothetical protein
MCSGHSWYMKAHLFPRPGVFVLLVHPQTHPDCLLGHFEVVFGDRAAQDDIALLQEVVGVLLCATGSHSTFSTYGDSSRLICVKPRFLTSTVCVKPFFMLGKSLAVPLAGALDMVVLHCQQRSSSTQQVDKGVETRLHHSSAKGYICLKQWRTGHEEHMPRNARPDLGEAEQVTCSRPTGYRDQSGRAPDPANRPDWKLSLYSPARAKPIACMRRRCPGAPRLGE